MAWTLPSGLGWLAEEHQGPSCLHLNSTHLLYMYSGIKLRSLNLEILSKKVSHVAHGSQLAMQLRLASNMWQPSYLCLSNLGLQTLQKARSIWRVTATLQEFLTKSGLSNCPAQRGVTKAFWKTHWQPVPGKLLTCARVIHHLDKWVAFSRRELGTLCAVIDTPLTPGIPNKKNAISSHCGGATAPPRTTQLRMVKLCRVRVFSGWGC